MKTDKSKVEIRDTVEFYSGNYSGLTGEIIKIEYGNKFPPYGLRFTVKLSDGNIGYIEKAEHWKFI
jgi:hypothetical protein